ncbi:MAG: hypothetical protein JRI57_06335 [Deltaproteobacteria bacterium]|nr:hypothetical protein [Deltaproteobacteria bacterium]MBW1952423.1 hypothetical protein [Deltaproteobacteria bacterium]MBW1986666.1 hypothetical protein [Deltaproteobacteria bacterium]MBW2134874.1 hypothetical protein [Deltaproteobacteria bacterium]
MRKRNKHSNIIVAHQLSPLTNHILAQMGEEGQVLRQRLEQFFQERAAVNHPDWHQQLDKEPHKDFN